MSGALDRSLDEILRDRRQSNRDSNERAPRGGNRGGSRGGNRGGNSTNVGGRRRDRSDYPRDGVRKSFRDDAPRNLDSEWVHDRFEDHGNRRPAPKRRHSPGQYSDSKGSRIRVDNIHYELTQEDLEELFSRIGPLVELDMKYDRAGRSEGTAFVTYESARDAQQAITEFDGANAAGQPIRLTLMPTGPRRNPFDSAVVQGRPLAERITIPGGRSRSRSPRRQEDEEAARRGIDRYRPGARGSRSRSPMPRRRDGGGGGRRPGQRRDGGGGRRGGGGGGGGIGGERGDKVARDGRPKKTQEELDAEMEDYFGGGGNAAPAADTNGAAAQLQATEDIDMIE